MSTESTAVAEAIQYGFSILITPPCHEMCLQLQLQTCVCWSSLTIYSRLVSYMCTYSSSGDVDMVEGKKN